MNMNHLFSALCFAASVSACVEQLDEVDPALSETESELRSSEVGNISPPPAVVVGPPPAVVVGPPPCPGNPHETDQWLWCEQPDPVPSCPVFNTSNPNGSFCTVNCPCDAGEGDCDTNQECAAGLVCGADNGPAYNLPANWDVCARPAPPPQRDPECYSSCMDYCREDGYSLPRQCVQQCRAECG